MFCAKDFQRPSSVDWTKTELHRLRHAVACTIVVSALGVWFAPSASHAQSPILFQRGIGTYTPPVNPVSPYINLANGNPAVSYFGVTQPQFQLQSAYSQLQQQVTTDQAAMAAGQNTAMTTGHGVQFMTFNRFFMRTPVTVPGTVSPAGSLYSNPMSVAGGGGARFGTPYTPPAMQRGYR